MNTIIKLPHASLTAEEFNTMKSDLEKLMEIEPDEKIKEESKRMNWSIDQKDIILENFNKNSYRIEFYHNEKEGEKKKCYLGSINLAFFSR
jgi:hypothetical protein